MKNKKYISSINVDQSTIRITPGNALIPFVDGDFYAEYESKYELSSLDDSILIIPFVLATAPIIWCSGEIVHLDRLDTRLTNSLPLLKEEYAKMYPNIHWNGEIKVKNHVSNFSSGGTEGLLFSGGLDSIHSELTNPGQKHLFTVWGADTDPNEDTPWSDIRLQTIRYADEYGHIPIFIRSNFRTFLRKQRLHTWHREISHWYTHVQHGPALIGLTAPIMILGGGHKLIIAASHWQEELRRGWGSSRSLDESAQFGDVMILHAGHDKTRQDKIKDIVNIRQNGPPREFVLRVCSKQIQGGGNCGTCEKCLRTSTGLILEGEDPRKWGFLNDPLSTMKLLKHKMQRFKLKMTDSEVRFWSAIQSRSREIQFSDDIQKYIEWLAHMNLKKQSAWYELLTGRKLYSICPKILRKLIRKVFFAFWRLNL